MNAQQFEAAYGGVADYLASKTRLSRVLFLAQFTLETGWGNSQLAHHNNLAGIKYTGYHSSNFGGFAAYDSLSWFEADYLRVISLPYYEHVLASAGQPIAEQVRQLGLSPWDAGHYKVQGGQPGSSLIAFVNVYAGDHPVPAPTPVPEGNFHWYTVQRGDSLSLIARKFGVASWQDIFELNRDRIKNPNLIYVSQVIRIPNHVTPTNVPSGVTVKPTPGHDYIIQRGDTLSAIAQAAYGNASEYSKIAAYNHIANPNLIYTGTKIHIP